MTSLQDRVGARKTYLAAKNIAATYEGFGELEAPEDFPEEDVNQIISRFLLIQRIAMQKPKSSLTNEPDREIDTPPAFESPFDKLDELRNDDEKVLEIISYVRNQSNICFAHRLADRLMFLVKAAKEEYPDEVAILPDSLRNFLAFLQSATNLNYPDVVLSPSKNIRAQWRTGSNRHFAVEFLTTGDTNFVIFSPDPKHPEKTIRLSGLVPVDSLIDTVQPHGVLAWSSR